MASVNFKRFFCIFYKKKTKFRAQLGTCIYHMVKCDFPQRWTQIVDKISIYLQNRGEYLLVHLNYQIHKLIGIGSLFAACLII